MLKTLCGTLFVSFLLTASASWAGPKYQQMNSDFQKIMGDTGQLLTDENALAEMSEMHCKLLDSDDQTKDGGKFVMAGQMLKIQRQDNGLVRIEGLTNAPVDFASTESGALESKFLDESLEIELAIRALRMNDRMIVFLQTRSENIEVISTCEKP